MALKVGLQLYTVRDEMQKDPLATIRKVAEIGYKYIELANLNADSDYGSGFGVSAADLKSAATLAGAEILSAHIDPFDDKNVDKVLEYHTQLGTKYLMSKPFEGTRAEMLAGAELYNRLGEKCRAAGIQHVLHTGLACYNEDGEWLLDVLYENTEPQNLMYELDTYWILRSGIDPIAAMKKFAPRVVLVHQKDLPKDFKGEVNVNKTLPRGVSLHMHNFFEYVQKEDFCEIGDGQMDIQGIIDAAVNETKATHIILEQDYTKYDSAFDSIKRSMDNFRKMRNIEA